MQEHTEGVKFIGEHTHTVNTENLSNGACFLRLFVDEEMTMIPFVVRK